MVADFLGAVREVIGSTPMQWPPTRPGRKGRKFHLVPAAASTACVSMRVEDDGELVHQRDVEVALRVLDDLGGLRDLDRGRVMGPGLDDPA